MTAGVIAVDRSAFERLDESHREIWMEVFARVLREQEARAVDENADAREALIDEGIEIVKPGPDDVAEWQRISREVLDEMRAAGEFEVPGLERLRQRLSEIRAE
jgi:TRAP-type C4-dicarboxylate transport system substrate-binding protein